MPHRNQFDLSALRKSYPEAERATYEASRVNARAMLEALDAIGRRKYDWDGGGGMPVREDVVRDIRHRVLGLHGMNLIGLPRAQMDLIADGSVEVSFTVGKRVVILTFLCYGVLNYWKSNEGATLVDGLIRLADGPTEQGHCSEIDSVTAWVLENQDGEWRRD